MNTKSKSILLIVAVSAITSFASIWGYGKWVEKHPAYTAGNVKIPANYADFYNGKSGNGGIPDFTTAATSATPAVVHIKVKIKGKASSGKNPFSDMFGESDPFFQFFGGPKGGVMPDEQASGSGVIITNDGYIVTNNHVVEDANEVKVTLNNRKTYDATVIGTDPNTDLAVLKIDASNLPSLVYGNSDDVKLGQWVLAVGYPLSLDVTVTAGIISAKSRSIGINKSDRAIESFLQTDAAVNPGNSGGALINTNGELIGINSAIASPTGSYAGYSYAIPVNIVKKTIGDLMKFGAVQRGYIGIQYAPDNISDEQRKAQGIKEGNGVYVTDVTDEGAAKAAGIQKGDFITNIDGATVTSGPELQEKVAGYKPGDKITVTYERNGKINTATIILKNKAGNTSIVKQETPADNIGGELATVDKETAKANDITGGVIVKKLGSGLLQKTRMQEGFVITSVDGQNVNSLDELKNILSKSQGTVRLEGIYPGYEGTYGYPLNLDPNAASDGSNGNN